jgi:hypothetical protein
MAISRSFTVPKEYDSVENFFRYEIELIQSATFSTTSARYKAPHEAWHSNSACHLAV